MNAVCESFKVNEKLLKEVKSKMPSEDIILKLTENFKTLSDATRIKILLALSHKELCVCELSKLLKISQSGVSHQLRILRNMNLVKFRKSGKQIYYSLADRHVINLMKMALAHAKH